jgi:hypothetical protein
MTDAPTADLTWLILVFVFVWTFWPLIIVAMLSRVHSKLNRIQKELSRLGQPPQDHNAHRDER